MGQEDGIHERYLEMPMKVTNRESDTTLKQKTYSFNKSNINKCDLDLDLEDIMNKIEYQKKIQNEMAKRKREIRRPKSK